MYNVYIFQLKGGFLIIEITCCSTFCTAWTWNNTHTCYVLPRRAQYLYVNYKGNYDNFEKIYKHITFTILNIAYF
jgi:hypothetical protein